MRIAGRGADRTCPYFMHIPRTGGTSVSAALDALHPEEERFSSNMMDDLLTADPGELQRCRVFRGHFGWLLSELLGAPMTVLVMLRDPVERAVSYFRFCQRIPEIFPVPSGIKGRSFSEVLDDPVVSRLFSNGQARHLAWRPPAAEFVAAARSDLQFAALSQFELADLEPYGLTGTGLLAAAFEGLNACAAVGVTSRMKVSLSHFSDALGIKIVAPEQRLNASPARSSVETLDPGLRRRIEEMNVVDLELYQAAETAVMGEGDR